LVRQNHTHGRGELSSVNRAADGFEVRAASRAEHTQTVKWNFAHRAVWLPMYGIVHEPRPVVQSMSVACFARRHCGNGRLAGASDFPGWPWPTPVCFRAQVGTSGPLVLSRTNGRASRAFLPGVTNADPKHEKFLTFHPKNGDESRSKAETAAGN
jgi:hypothetical protein